MNEKTTLPSCALCGAEGFYRPPNRQVAFCFDCALAAVHKLAPINGLLYEDV